VSEGILQKLQKWLKSIIAITKSIARGNNHISIYLTT